MHIHLNVKQFSYKVFRQLTK